MAVTKERPICPGEKPQHHHPCYMKRAYYRAKNRSFTAIGWWCPICARFKQDTLA